jgi:hypothetical protein
MNLTLIWFLVLPIIGGATIWHFNRNTSAGVFLAPIAFVPGAILIGLVFLISYGSAVIDTEIWSGQVVSKTRKHDTYEESYECNCKNVSRTVGSGKDARTVTDRVCDTCYRTHYTVDWDCQTTVGSFRIDRKDSTWRSVYDSADPARYTSIQKGDPAAKTAKYTNYVQAVPNSLFAAVGETTKARFAGKLPAYPDQIYDFYRINRFLSPGFSFLDAGKWNEDISNILRDLGPAKQVNVIVVVAKTDDRAYTAALRDHWEGANKNDVVLVIGSLDGTKIEFAEVMSWTKSEIFKIELQDRVQDIGVIERNQIMSAVQQQIVKNFQRRHMREFEYLKGAIDPPMWLLVTLLITLVAGYGIAAAALTGALDRFSGRNRRGIYGRRVFR